MCKILLFVLSVAAVSGNSLPNDCELGENHWCLDLKTAKKCMQVDHCMKTVWEVPPFQKSSDEVCQFCENFVGDARNFLTDNQTEKRVESFLDQACQVIPISELSDQCLDYIKNDIPEVFNMIRSKLNPKSVCSALHLCPGFAVHTSQLKFVTPNVFKFSPAGDVCKDCSTFVDDLKVVIGNKQSLNTIEHVLKVGICDRMDILKDQCTDAINEYIPEIIELLTSDVDSKVICQVVRACGPGKTVPLFLVKMKLRKHAPKINGDAECTFCKDVFSGLQSLDRSAKVQSHVKDFLDSEVCSHLGGHTPDCRSFVGQYLPLIFQLLVDELDPAERCLSFGMCPAELTKSLARDLGSSLLLRTQPLSSMASPSSFDKPTSHATASVVDPSSECVLCEFVMTQVDKLLEQNRTSEDIINALDKVCHIMPDTIKKQCAQFVDQYAAGIIELLSQELSPKLVCSTLKLCVEVKSANQSAKPANQSAKPTKAVVGASEKCPICETVVQYVDSLLKENATREDIEKAVEAVCTYLPSDLKTKCDNFVTEYGAKVIDMITSFADPKAVCTELKLCGAQKVAMAELIPAKKVHLLGMNECSQGPAFWCSTPENARKCNAIDHCVKHVWNN